MEKNQQSDVNPQPRVENNSGDNGRRRFLWGGLLAMLGALRGGTSAVADGDTPNPNSIHDPLITEGTPLKTVVKQGRVRNVPLNTMVLFERGENVNRPIAISLAIVQGTGQSLPQKTIKTIVQMAQRSPTRPERKRISAWRHKTHNHGAGMRPAYTVRVVNASFFLHVTAAVGKVYLHKQRDITFWISTVIGQNKSRENLCQYCSTFFGGGVVIANSGLSDLGP